MSDFTQKYPSKLMIEHALPPWLTQSLSYKMLTKSSKTEHSSKILGEEFNKGYKRVTRIFHVIVKLGRLETLLLFFLQ